MGVGSTPSDSGIMKLNHSSLSVLFFLKNYISFVAATSLDYKSAIFVRKKPVNILKFTKSFVNVAEFSDF